MQEVWKESFQSRFEVSNKGRFRSIKRKVPYKKVYNNNGYTQVTVWDKKEEKYKTKLLHRLVAKAFIPNPDNKNFVNHKNGIKDDNRVENLEWVTRQENEEHAFRTGLKNSTGSNNKMSKLDEDSVRWIKDNYSKPKDAHLFANKFGVHRATIQRIINGKIWTHV